MSLERQKELEVVQNNALRTIFKINRAEHFPIEELRRLANVSSIYERHTQLLQRYYGQAILTSNPLVLKMFDEYRTFKHRKCEDPSIATFNGVTNQWFLNDIVEANKRLPYERERYPTLLCRANRIIRNFIYDDFSGHHGNG